MKAFENPIYVAKPLIPKRDLLFKYYNETKSNQEETFKMKSNSLFCVAFSVLIAFFLGIMLLATGCANPKTTETNCKIIKPVEYIEKECNCSCPEIDCYSEIQEAIDDYRQLEQRFKNVKRIK